MTYRFNIFRDCDSTRGASQKIAIRKMVVELYVVGAMVYDGLHTQSLDAQCWILRDRIRMFAGPWYEGRLRRRMKRMIKRAEAAQRAMAEERG